MVPAPRGKPFSGLIIRNKTDKISGFLRNTNFAGQISGGPGGGRGLCKINIFI
jgi:hypothetical protein